jgi:hypothetical protein
LSQLQFDFLPRRPKKRFNLHRFILATKIIVVEILSAIVFLIWVLRSFLGEVHLR